MQRGIFVVVAAACVGCNSGTVAVKAPLTISSGASPVVSMRQAGKDADGFLSKTDFATFDGKVDGTDPRLTDSRKPTPGATTYIQNNSSAPQTADLSITGEAKAGSFTATRFPRLVGFLEGNPPTPVKLALLTGWTVVPKESDADPMEISVNVENPTDLYLVTYTYRVNTSNSQKFSGIRVLNSSQTEVSLVTGAGMITSVGDTGMSGSIVIRNLPQGAYKFQLVDYCPAAGDRTFSFTHQLMVYRLQ
jgi:hypothetical protein